MKAMKVTKLSLLTTFAAGIVLSSVSVRAGTTEYFNHATFTGLAGAVTVVGFDDVGSGLTFSDDRYEDVGLTVVHRDGYGQVAFDPTTVAVCCYTAANRQSAPNVASSANFSGVDNFDFIFVHTVYAAGLWIGNISPGTTEVQFLDAAGTLLASEVIAHTHPNVVYGGGASWDVRLFYGVISDTPIARIRTVEGCCDSDGVTYDDVTFTSITGPDGDGDGVPDSEDNCPLTPNADQADTDADTIGNVCDACPLDPLNDVDGDGICGDVDNCPNTSNPDQADADHNGVGNVCDASNDTDGDGIPNTSDGCPHSPPADGIIIIDGCNTGVPNLMLANGCTIADHLNELAAAATNHGEFVSGVAQLKNSLRKQGILTSQQANAIQTCAAQAQIP